MCVLTDIKTYSNKPKQTNTIAKRTDQNEDIITLKTKKAALNHLFVARTGVEPVTSGL